MTSLDVDAVRAFVTIADLKSFTRAADALGTTQGAISVKLKRLEDRLGHRLLERTPRMVRLSAQGSAFIDGARDFLAAHERALAGLSMPAGRRFSLGIATHIAGPEVPALLARLNAQDPALTIELRMDNSRALLNAFDHGQIDAVIVGREDDRRGGDILAQERVTWFAAPSFDYQQGEPIRLAALSPACGVHNIATRALDAAGIGWTEVFLGGGSFAVMAAVSAGLAIAPFRAGWRHSGQSMSANSTGCPHSRCRRSCSIQHCRMHDRATRCARSLRYFAHIGRCLRCLVPASGGSDQR